MTDANGDAGHPDVAEISDLAEGLLGPARSGEVRSHLDVCALCADDAVRPDGSMITNRRQAEALKRAAEAALHAAEALCAGFTPDIAWVDAEAALSAIGEVTGQTVNAEILSRVFERFCVGK